MAELDILADGFGEQDLLLRNISHPAVQLIQRNALNRNTGNADLTCSCRIFMQQLLQQGGFTAAGASDDA
ncbi:hypothetical protein D3C73_1474220 [compost metagenome]